MAKTSNLGLNVWGEYDNAGNWLDWRLAMAGDSSESNMVILDAWAKQIEDQIENIQPELTFDHTPTQGSDNPVTSNGIKSALDDKQDELTFDATPRSGSSNPVTSEGIHTALNTKADDSDLTTHTSDSSIHVTDGEKSTWNEKQDKLTFDNTPTQNSSNPVTSGGIYSALSPKADNSALTSHTDDTTVHVTSGEKTDWSGKQTKITASGLLKGNGAGGVSAAVAGTDYAAADHNHDGEYCTQEELNEGLAGKAPAFSPVVNVTAAQSMDQYVISEEVQGKMLVISASTTMMEYTVVIDEEVHTNIPVGFECEIMYRANSGKCIICAPLRSGNKYFSTLYSTIDPEGTAHACKISSQYGVAVLKKIAANEWLVGGDIKEL